MNIPWLFPSSVLTSISSNLFNNTCNLWIDSKEIKAINVTRQQIISKDYNSNILIIAFRMSQILTSGLTLCAIERAPVAGRKGTRGAGENGHHMSH